MGTGTREWSLAEKLDLYLLKLMSEFLGPHEVNCAFIPSGKTGLAVSVALLLRGHDSPLVLS